MADGPLEWSAPVDGWAMPPAQGDVARAEPMLAAAPGVLTGAAELVAARARLESSETYTALAQLFGALADPTRARIVHLLMQHEWTTSQIAAITGATEPATSQHLRVLRDLHLVRSRRAGRWVYYRLDDLHVALLMRTSLAHLRDERTHVHLEARESAREYGDAAVSAHSLDTVESSATMAEQESRSEVR